MKDYAIYLPIDVGMLLIFAELLYCVWLYEIWFGASSEGDICPPPADRSIMPGTNITEA